MQNSSIARVSGGGRRQSKLKPAFTLAEVLITLGIIGVVAALTLPTLIQKQQEKERVTALKKFYSTISQAYEFAVMKNGSPDLWGLDLDNSERLLTYLSPQMKFIKFCKNGDKCHPAEKLSYRNGTIFNNITFNPTAPSRYAAVLPDGMVVGTWVQDANCKAAFAQGKHLEHVCGEYMVDINGGKNPNRYGDDIFIFNITKYGIVPVGAEIYRDNIVQAEEDATRYAIKNYRFDTGCLAKTAQGYGCAGWVISNGNQDYLHCDDLSWTGKTKCK